MPPIIPIRQHHLHLHTACDHSASFGKGREGMDMLWQQSSGLVALLVTQEYVETLAFLEFLFLAGED